MTNESSTSTTTTRKLVHAALRLALLVLVATAAVALGNAAGMAPYVGYALPATQHIATTTSAQALHPLPEPTNPDHQANQAEYGDCEARGLVTAEDYSCVPANFYNRDAQPGTVVIEWGEVSEAMWERLLDLGYRGDPTDGREALYVPADVAQANCVTDSDCYGHLVAIDADTAPDAAVELLLAAGYQGDPNDGQEAIYAPLNTVLFDELGTWTVTADGMARCEHGTERACTGYEWLR